MFFFFNHILSYSWCQSAVLNSCFEPILDQFYYFVGQFFKKVVSFTIRVGHTAEDVGHLVRLLIRILQSLLISTTRGSSLFFLLILF